MLNTTNQDILETLQFIKENAVTKEDISKQFSEQEYTLKDFIDKKFDYYITDIFRRINKKDASEKQFKQRVVELFRKNKIGSKEDLAFLDGLLTSTV